MPCSFFIDDGYQKLTKPKIGGILIRRAKKNIYYTSGPRKGELKIKKGEIEHSAIITGVDTSNNKVLVKEKNGQIPDPINNSYSISGDSEFDHEYYKRTGKDKVVTEWKTETKTYYRSKKNDWRAC